MSPIIKLSPPVQPFVLTQGFGENPDVYKQFGRAGHNGIDYGVVSGTRVLAAADGIIQQIGWDKSGYGEYIVIDHHGFYTLYAHLDPSMEIMKGGEQVYQGQVIGYSDNTGFSTGPHLHFELRIPDNKTAGYPAGETDPRPFFMDNDTLQNTLKMHRTQGRQSPGSQEAEIASQQALATTQAKSLQDTKETRYQTCHVIAKAGLNAHLQPKIDSPIIGAFKYRQELAVMKQEGDWLGVLVWVHQDWVKR